MTDLVTFGETMLRLSPPDDAPIETADRFDVRAAGAESNVAVTAQRLGLETVWCSQLPDDARGRRVVGALRRHGVGTAVSWTDDGRVGTYYLEGGVPPREQSVLYDREGAAIRSATPADLPTDRIAAASAFHTTGITPALSDTLAETTADLLARAQETETTTVFDLNYRSKLWTPDDAAATVRDLLADVDVFVLAKRDAATVLSSSGDPKTVVGEIHDEYDFETTVLTCGSDGVVALHGGDVLEQPAFAAADAYPVGTGDAFVGGFLARRLRDGSVPDALEYGAAAAALKRAYPGDVGVFTPAEVERVRRGDDSETDSIDR